MNQEKQEVLTDLQKLADNYYEASSVNADHANKAISHLQNGLLTIILAELAFLGAANLSKDTPSIICLIAAGILILSAFGFILGSHAQWRHIIKIARSYFSLSKNVVEFIKKTGITEIVNLPDFLSDKLIGLETDKQANKLFFASTIGVFIASVLIFVYLIGLITN